MRYSVPWLFDGFQWIPNASIEWYDDTIIGVEKCSPQSSEYLEKCILIPGLVNLHTHLELSALQNLMPRGVLFPEWVKALQSQTKLWSEHDFEQSFYQGLVQCMEFGTTSVLDIGNSGVAQKFMETKGLRLFPRHELLGLDHRLGMDRFENARKNVIPPAGLCAHAPYSCSSELIHSIVNDCQQRGIGFTMHLAESREEAELYELGVGIFRDWIDQFYPGHSFRKPRGGAWKVALECGLPKHSILAHGNMLTHEEKLFALQHDCTLVHCPQSARWFGHPALNIKECLQAGLSVALGTDSLASAESLSLWDQMALLWSKEPALTCSEILSMATGIAGRALDCSGALGQLKARAHADFLLIQLPEVDKATKGEWIRSHNFQIRAKFVAGIKV